MERKHENMKIEELPEFIIEKILHYMPLEVIFRTMQYTSRKFKSLCELYTLPREIDTQKISFLNNNQICQLIQNSSHLKQFHFNRIGTDGTVFKCLTKFAKSLERLSLSDVYLKDDADLLSLVTCGHKFTELQFREVDCVNYFETMNQFNDFPALDSVKKIAIYKCQRLKLDAVIRLLNACRNATHVTVRSVYIPQDAQTNTHIIRENSSQLRYLDTHGERGDESPHEITKCINLKTLHLCWMDPTFCWPILPNISKLILEFGDQLDIEYVKVLKSFPNVRELVLTQLLQDGKQTSKYVAQLHNLRKITIYRTGMTKNDVASIFRNSRSLKFANVDLSILADMSNEEIIISFSGLHVLQGIQSLTENCEVAKRLANLLPQTKIYQVRAHDYFHILPFGQRTRIWPQYCQFQI